jgi:hypothetical protein
VHGKGGGADIADKIRRTNYVIEAFRKDKEVRQVRLGNWTLEKA